MKIGIDIDDTTFLTVKSMLKYADIFEEEISGVPISDKLTFCKEHQIDILIEDSYETCRELSDNGIKSILMTTKMNTDIETKL